MCVQQPSLIVREALYHLKRPFFKPDRFLRAPNKMGVAPRSSVFAPGKEGEAGHPRMVDGA